jgi:hypothetical protein
LRSKMSPKENLNSTIRKYIFPEAIVITFFFFFFQYWGLRSGPSS